MKTAKTIVVSAALLIANALPCVHAGATFEAIKQRGVVQCGLSAGVPGFSMADSRGQWKGIDVDLCRAFAATMFNDARKVRLVPLSDQQRFTALQAGEVDVLIRNSTQTMTRDTALGLIGAGVNFYDGQGIMVSKDLGVASALELNDATVCVSPGTTMELNLSDWFIANGLKLRPVVIEQYDELIRAFATGRCDAFTVEKSLLAAIRATMLENPDNYVILPESLSKEPLGPQVRQGDEQWFNVVRWTLNAMLEAEEYGITSHNVDDMLKSNNPNVQRILGVTPGMGKHLGVDDRWAYNVIKQVGNYGESFEANLGQASPMKLPRGMNAQWRDGGLMYGWPIR